MRTPTDNPGDDLVEIRAELAKATTGPDYWRSLEELAGTETFQHFLHREFPENATELANPESRRTFLKVMSSPLIECAGNSPPFSGCLHPDRSWPRNRSV